ncbi:hypothetical protein EDC94DRAFT_581776 [Helicostylum pulchrum]|nr:hypothetical protein EDC94DRAFT_581776 [Helicostylum pulchrum]
MASQRNNITLLEVQMLLQRTIMNESQSILGKLDNLGATINDLREEAIAAKEENMSLKEELSSLKNKINMVYSSVGNDLSVSSPRFAGEAIVSAEQNGLFSDNLYPLRSITKETLKAPTHFVWKTYHKLAERVIGRSMTKEEFGGCCKDNVNIGVLNPVMYTIKKSYHPMYERKPSFCHWGEKMLLMRMWHRTSQYYTDEDEEEGENRVAAQTILRQEEQEEQEEEQEEDVHKEEDIQNFTDTDPFEDLENPIVEGPLLERAEDDYKNISYKSFKKLLKYNLQDDGALSETRYNLPRSKKYCQNPLPISQSIWSGQYSLQCINIFGLFFYKTLGVFYLLHSKLKDLVGLPRFTFYTELYYMALVHSLVNCFYSFGITRRWNETLVHSLQDFTWSLTKYYSIFYPIPPLKFINL